MGTGEGHDGVVVRQEDSGNVDIEEDSTSRHSVGSGSALTLKCSVPTCHCHSFTPGHSNIRCCDNCSHSWVPHARHQQLHQSSVDHIASLVLYGCQALPIRLKILLDRMFSVLRREEVLQVLAGFGWTLEDYARGYVLQGPDGEPLESWQICSSDEEPLIIRQFLRFSETRTLALQLLQSVHADASHPRHSLPPSPARTSPPASPPRAQSHSPGGYEEKPPPPPPSSIRVLPLGHLAAAEPEAEKTPKSGHQQQAAIPSLIPISFLEASRAMKPVSLAKQKEDHSSSVRNGESALNLSRRKDNHQALLTKQHWASMMTEKPVTSDGAVGKQLVNPVTGKKRAQCNVCLKTFCDKGAFKIHFSAVHLREMHKCTRAGCNMMFSSRRSRNRHSANPNPKLHSMEGRTKVSPQFEGRNSDSAAGSEFGFSPLTQVLKLLQHPQRFDEAASQESSAKETASSEDSSMSPKHSSFYANSAYESEDNDVTQDVKKEHSVETSPVVALKRAKLEEVLVGRQLSWSDKTDGGGGGKESLTDACTGVDLTTQKGTRKRKNQNPTRCRVSVFQLPEFDTPVDYA